MKNKIQIANWQTKRLAETIVGLTIVIFAMSLFLKEKYGWSVLLVLALFVLLKIDTLEEFAFTLKNGFFAKFKTPAEKVEENIRENMEPITKQNFTRFQNIEAKILANYQKRYAGELKTLIHYIYGPPLGKPEFSYTPDGSLQTQDTLYFFEIKYILKPKLAKKIVNDTLRYLNEVYKKLSPSMGDKKFVIKLILASGHDLSKMSFDTPPGIELEFYKV